MQSVAAKPNALFWLAHICRVLGLISVLFLTACASQQEYDPTRDWSAAKLYEEAKQKMSDGGYTEAIKYLEKLEARYPYGRYAQQAQMEIPFAYWKSGEPASGIAACDRFIKLHPSHPNLDYIYYLKGLISYNEDKGLFSSISQQDPAERDPKSSREAFEAFRELTTRFPNSKYAADATTKMEFLVNSMVAQEVNVARYYMVRGAYLAAANRAQAAIRNYPSAPAQEEALAIMVKAYRKLNLDDLSKDAERVLLSSYPNTKLLNESSAGTEKSWWQKIF